MKPAAPYFGNIVRKLFIICGLVILITLPFLKTLAGPVFYSLIFVLLLAFFAGMTKPRHKAILVSDVIVSMFGFGFFAYQGIINFQGHVTLFFITNIVLAILFLFAFYWSVKTARELHFPKHIEIVGAKNLSTPINASEDSPAAPKRELTEEDRRRNRFLGSEN
jgi:hypothetical protein